MIQCHLQKRGYKFVRLDGSMNIRKRDDALDAFSTSPQHTIMLASLAVCSVGVSSLTLTTLIIVEFGCGKSSYFGG